MPRRDYRNARGEKLPGVTTIIDQVFAKPALLWWAYRQGQDGVPLYQKRDEAADAGTFAHALIESHLKGDPSPPADNLKPELVDKAEGCFLAYLEWEQTHRFEMVASEIPLVSETFQFGGTIDIGGILKTLQIVDIKTSKSVYISMRMQVAAYGLLWNENNPDSPIEGYRILRLGRDGEFSDNYWPSLDDELEMFLHGLEVYKILRRKGEKL